MLEMSIDIKNYRCKKFHWLCRSAETSLERAESGRARWEQEAAAARDLAQARQHQLATMSDLLDAAKAKVCRMRDVTIGLVV